MKLTWNNAEDIALALIERYPEKDPLSLRFTELREMITSLADFADDPAKSSEGILETIQMAWFEEWQA